MESYSVVCALRDFASLSGVKCVLILFISANIDTNSDIEKCNFNDLILIFGCTPETESMARQIDPQNWIFA